MPRKPRVEFCGSVWLQVSPLFLPVRPLSHSLERKSRASPEQSRIKKLKLGIGTSPRNGASRKVSCCASLFQVYLATEWTPPKTWLPSRVHLREAITGVRSGKRLV